MGFIIINNVFFLSWDRSQEQIGFCVARCFLGSSGNTKNLAMAANSCRKSICDWRPNSSNAERRYAPSTAVNFCLHGILVQTVHDLRAISSYTDDLWISFCYNWNPQEWLTLDPARYSLPFLSDFIAHATCSCGDETSYEEYRMRPSKKARTTPMWQQMSWMRIENPISAICIAVGQAELYGNTCSSRASYHQECVSLPSCFVTHSGAGFFRSC